LINSAIEVKKTEVDAKIQITDPNQLALLSSRKKQNYIRGLVGTRSAKATGANVRGLPERASTTSLSTTSAKAGVFAIRRAKKSDMEALGQGHRRDEWSPPS